MKRTLSFILALVLLIGLMPMQAFATEATVNADDAEILRQLARETSFPLGNISGNIAVLGDSTISGYPKYSALSTYFSVADGYTITDISKAGDTIVGQLNKWKALSATDKSALNYVFVQIGLNDTDKTAETFRAQYTSLIAQIRADAPDAMLILGTMVPCKQRWKVLYPNAWEEHQERWEIANEDIRNGYYDCDRVAYLHTEALGLDGNLRKEYNHGDHIHENAEGAKVIAYSWYLAAFGHSHRYSSIVTSPTCTEQGYTTYTCACGDSYVADYMDATGHSYANGICADCGVKDLRLSNYQGKVISIMGDSISTFAGYIPVADGFNLAHKTRYPQDNLLTDVNETWWMQVIKALDAKLGINESWASSEVYNYIDEEVNSTSDGTKACMASITRIQNLGSNGTPDVILFFGGTNDITQSRPLGTFDPATAPTEVDLISVKWDTVADAYVDAIMRMQYYYPGAQIVAMLPFYRNSQGTAKVDKYNDLFASICEHYGVTYVDLRYCGITNTNLPDGTHPEAIGMDYITDAVMEVLTDECKVTAGEHIVHSVTHNLNGATSSLGYYKGISHRKSFTTTITGDDIMVTVTMGGVDITSDCYTNGVVSIDCVTGDLVITVEGRPKTVYADYLQELPDDLCFNTNLWTILKPINLYYRASSGWGLNATGLAHSITFPVFTGDQIWATSFQESGLNGGTKNGIALTWFDAEGVIETFTPEKTYAEFAKNGYLTAPEGAVAVNVVMWNGDKTSEVYILNRDHCYKNGVCSACGHNNGPVITQQPESVEQEIGKKFAITVKAEGEELTYQWYYKNAGGKTFAASSNKTSSYSYTMADYMHNRQVYCVITDANGNSVQTETATITRPPQALKIIEQPQDARVNVGEKFSISPKVEGEGLTYQWYVKEAGAKAFKVSSNKTASYAYTMQNYMIGRQVYCVITDKYGNSVTTDVATISLPPVELKILQQPSDVYASKGEKFSISFVVQGDGLTYQWYVKESGAKTFKVSSNKTSTYAYSMQNYMNGRQVYCVITDKYGNQVVTEVVTIHLEK